MPLQRLDDPARARELCHAARAQGRSIGIVPTMGALHAGHLELVARARAENDLVVVSVFVNPLQFDKAVDLEKYPRDEDGDAAMLEAVGCDLMVTGALCGEGGFFPEHARAEGIPKEEPGPAAAGMEHLCRVGHFDGVATIIRRLFELSAASRAYFGLKDFQQVLVARHVAAALNAEVGEERLEVVGCETSREPSGLARSSRNLRMSDQGRRAAVGLSMGLFRTRRAWREDGERDPARLEALFAAEVAAARERLGVGLDAHPGGLPDLTPEYTAARDPEAWTEGLPAGSLARGVALTAGWVEGVRPIDNLMLSGEPLASEEEVARLVAEVAAATDGRGHRPPAKPASGLDLRPGEVAAVEVAAPAKVNPNLEVVRRSDDGFHEVDLTMLSFDLEDRLRLAWSAAPGELELAVHGPAASADVPVDESNLVHRAASAALADLDGLPAGHLVIELEKHVPSRAGLGGGSSDAAAALFGVLELGRLLGAAPRAMAPDGPDAAAALAALGSDCSFFLAARATGFARCTGRGERVEPLVVPDDMASRAILVLTPDLECPTAGVYAELAADLAERAGPRPGPRDPGAAFNRLEPPALRLVPELAALKSRLDAALPGKADADGASPWLLSGSGSSFFQWQAPGASPFDLDERRRLAAALCDAEPRHAGLHRAIGAGVRVTASAVAAVDVVAEPTGEP